MATTPNYGWPLPDGTSLPDVPYWFNQLGTAIENSLPGPINDTTSITAATGWTLATSQIFVRRGMVHVYINATRSGAAIAAASSGNITNIAVANVPAAYWPIAPIGGATVASGVTASCYIWTDGVMGIGALPPGVGVATGDSITASFVYPMP